jgi:hypothetical protein
MEGGSGDGRSPRCIVEAPTQKKANRVLGRSGWIYHPTHTHTRRQSNTNVRQRRKEMSKETLRIRRCSPFRCKNEDKGNDPLDSRARQENGRAQLHIYTHTHTVSPNSFTHCRCAPAQCADDVVVLSLLVAVVCLSIEISPNSRCPFKVLFSAFSARLRSTGEKVNSPHARWCGQHSLGEVIPLRADLPPLFSCSMAFIFSLFTMFACLNFRSFF